MSHIFAPFSSIDGIARHDQDRPGRQPAAGDGLHEVAACDVVPRQETPENRRQRRLLKGRRLTSEREKIAEGEVLAGKIMPYAREQDTGGRRDPERRKMRVTDPTQSWRVTDG